MSIEYFNPIPIDQALLASNPLRAHRILRLNCLGSLYYFIKNGLRRKKLTDSLHFPICRYLERDHIKDLMEISRDHFKSTMGSEGLPIWRALPFNNQDEDDFRQLGYSEEFVAWMRRRHDPDVRNLLVSENITNAAKLGRKTRWHFESNPTFRSLFPEILPDTSCVWTNFSLHLKRPKGQGGSHGEGTFDFLGVGGALQSRHYNGIIVQDDLVGRKAVESQSIMDDTIEYHKLLIGAYEDEDPNHEGDELVIGNRWGFHDLSSYIREHEPWFKVTMHGALGGCCALHKSSVPILPEVFTYEKLMRIKERLGSYLFSCQFLNNPAAPENAEFRTQWLGFYSERLSENGDVYIEHEVKDGLVRKNLKLGSIQSGTLIPGGPMRIGMAVDPAHSANAGAGRCRHAIVVVGLASNGDFYLLDCWAEAGSYEKFFGKIKEMAKRWRIRKVGFETIASQKFAAYHLSFLNRGSDWPIRIIELKGEVENEDGTITRNKTWRIRNMLAPIFETGRFWTQHRFQDFIAEYETFPKGRFCDQLDAMAYVPNMLKIPMDTASHMQLLAANQAGMKKVNVPYSVSSHSSFVN